MDGNCNLLNSLLHTISAYSMNKNEQDFNTILFSSLIRGCHLRANAQLQNENGHPGCYSRTELIWRKLWILSISLSLFCVDRQILMRIIRILG